MPNPTRDPFAPITRDDAPWIDLPDHGPDTIGYPVHRAVASRTWVNPHRAGFVDWRAFCGAEGTVAGGEVSSVFDHGDRAYRAELCTRCYPSRDFRRPAR